MGSQPLCLQELRERALYWEFMTNEKVNSTISVMFSDGVYSGEDSKVDICFRDTILTQSTTPSVPEQHFPGLTIDFAP